MPERSHNIFFNNINVVLIVRYYSPYLMYKFEKKNPYSDTLLLTLSSFFQSVKLLFF